MWWLPAKAQKKVYDVAREKGYKIPRLFKMPQRITPFFGTHD
jgi:hypothetical protein